MENREDTLKRLDEMEERAIELRKERASLIEIMDESNILSIRKKLEVIGFKLSEIREEINFINTLDEIARVRVRI